MSERIISKDELLTGEWTPFRNEVWSSSVLSAGAKVCYVAICSHIWKGGETSAWPGQKRLANLLSVTDRSVRNYLGELESVGLITVERRCLNRTNIYYLHKPNPERLKPKHGADRKILSAPERKNSSAPERKEASYKEEAVEEEALNNNHLSKSNSLEPSTPNHPRKDDDEVKDENRPTRRLSSSVSDLPIIEKTFPPEHTQYLVAIGECLSSHNVSIELAQNTQRAPNFRTVTKWWREIPLECAQEGIAATVANAEKSNIDINFKPLKYFENEIMKAVEKHTEKRKANEAAKRLKLATDERIAKKLVEQKEQAKVEIPRTFGAAMAANGGG